MFCAECEAVFEGCFDCFDVASWYYAVFGYFVGGIFSESFDVYEAAPYAFSALGAVFFAGDL